MWTAASLQPAMIRPAVEAEPSTARAVASVQPGRTEAAPAAVAEEAGETSIVQDFFGAAAERLDGVNEDTEKQVMVPAPPSCGLYLVNDVDTLSVVSITTIALRC